MPDGDTRNFSMANPPHESDGAQLHIRHVPGGRFSEGVLAGLRQGDKLEVELPYGDFYLRADSEKPIIRVATGTGFAPLKSMIEDLIKRGSKPPVHLYWGGRHRQDLYLAKQEWSVLVRPNQLFAALSCPRSAASSVLCSQRAGIAVAQGGQRRDHRPETAGIWRMPI
jgi:NAD(P)H-flavin reductase